MEDYWPRRLLHIPTLTSIERNAHGEYGGVSKPGYSILTYTWGRWKVTGADATHSPPRALSIKGTTWAIPIVQPSHFTVEAFHAVLDRMLDGGTTWAWLDIACIDQEDEAVNADEVGHQAGIFKNAAKAYVWLSETSNARLTDAAVRLNEHSFGLCELGDVTVGPLPSAEALQAHVERLLVSLPHVVESLDIILQDPWFSSLWTLQEAVLRTDALVLSAEGQPVLWLTWGDKSYAFFLHALMNICWNIYRDLQRLQFLFQAAKQNKTCPGEWEDGPSVKTTVDALATRIRQSGMASIPAFNPNTQFGMAQYRKTSRAVDRVYAIMQIYNLRVGKSLRPHDNPMLEDLVTEFAEAITRGCAVLGQAFIHTRPPRPGLSWRITEDSVIPHCFRILRRPVADCVMSFDGPRLFVRGRVCRLSSLLSIRHLGQVTDPAWDERSGLLERADGRAEVIPDIGVVAGRSLENLVYGYESLLDVPNSAYTLPPDRMPPLFAKLWVLYVGDIVGMVDRGPTFVDDINRQVVGVILHPVGTEPTDHWVDGPCRRVGLYSWQMTTKQSQEALEALHWESANFEFL